MVCNSYGGNVLSRAASGRGGPSDGQFRTCADPAVVNSARAQATTPTVVSFVTLVSFVSGSLSSFSVRQNGQHHPVFGREVCLRDPLDISQRDVLEDIE